MTDDLNQFLKDHHVMYKAMADGYDLIIYNNKKCIVKIVSATETCEFVEIRPLSSEWDIDMGHGESKFMTFMKKQTTNE